MDKTADSEAELIRREETLEVASRWADGEHLRISKTLEAVPVSGEVDRRIAYFDEEHVPPDEEDDGQVHELSDGTLSIPVLEEQIVVTKRTVVRERLLVHRHVQSERVFIEDEVRREHVAIESDDGVSVEVHERGYTAPFPNSSADPRRKVR